MANAIIAQSKDTLVKANGRSLVKDIRLIQDRNVLPFHTTFTTKVDKIIELGKEVLRFN